MEFNMRNMQVGLNIDLSHSGGIPPIHKLVEWNVDWIRFSHKNGHDTYSWTKYLGEAHDNGIKTLMILGYETVPGFPAIESDDNTWDKYIQKLIPECTRTIRAFGSSVDAIQIWNEPDLVAASPAYDPRVKPKIYAKMVNQVSRAIREVSQAKIVGAGLASGNPNWFKEVQTALEPKALDAIAVHPYGQRPALDWPSHDWGFGVLSNLIKAYQVFGLPIWVTEIGTSDLGVQNRFPIHAFWTLDKLVPITFWFCYSDNMVLPYGLVDANDKPKGSLEWFVDYTSESREGGQPTEEYKRGRRDTINEIRAMLSELSV